MEYSKYQLDIFDAYEKTDKNIVVSARAGASKTTVLLECLKRKKPHHKAIFLAFNKSIAEELKRRVPFGVDVMTIHSYGAKLLFKYWNGDVEIKPNKTFSFCFKFLKEWNLQDNNKKYEYMGTISELVDLYRLYLCNSENELRKIADYQGITCLNGEIGHSIELMKSLEDDIYYGDKRQIDFTDMIYLPATIDDIEFKKYDEVFVDECFPYEQNIVTEIGKKQIGSLVNNFNQGKSVPKILSFNFNQGIFEYKNILNVWNRGIKSTILLKINNKRKIECTENHLLLSDIGWKRAIDFNIGDIILSNVNEQPYSSILNSDQEQIFLASKIGDGSIHKVSNNSYRCRFIHGELQKDYLYWKSFMFGNIDVKYKEKNGYSNKPAYICSTKTHIIKDELFDSYKFIDKLDIRGVSILFMDDGSMLSNNHYTLYSSSTDKNRIHYLNDHINNLLGVNGIVCESKSSSTKRSYWYLRYIHKDSMIICENIVKYIHPIFKYKIFDQYKKLINKYQWNNKFLQFGGMVVTDKILNYDNKKVFDIEIEDNHNFIITSKSEGNNMKSGANGGFIVHNCQDLSKCQQIIVENIVKKNGRTIFVGDEFQSIYSFLGADIQSFNNVKNRPNTISLPLSISYRCAKNIVKKANTVFDITEPFEKAPDGEVREGSIHEVESGDFVLCRNNQPLVEVYLNFLVQGKKAHIKGKDLGESLLRLVSKIEDMSLSEGQQFLRELLSEIIKDLQKSNVQNPFKHPRYLSLKEKIDIISILIDKYGTFQKLQIALKEMFVDDIKDGIVLSTIHKSKGLEANRVFIIRKELIPSQYAKKKWEIEQEKNLLYVAYTRAKNSLIFVTDF